MTAVFDDDALDAQELDDLADGSVPESPFEFVTDSWRGLEAELESAFEGTGPGTREEDTYTPSISEGDFLDPAQRFLFRQLKARIREACNVNSKESERTRALEWLFVPGIADRDGLECDPLCRALGGRAVVVRARTMHQLWRANILRNEPLPMLAHVPPTSVMSEISAVIGPNLPEQMARDTWFWPSIHTETLRAKYPKASDREFQVALDSLEANGYLGIAYARLYFISRNPTILGAASRARFQFAASIYGEY